MRLITDRFNNSRLYRTINFDLCKAIFLIAIDCLDGLFFRICLDNTQGKLPFPSMIPAFNISGPTPLPSSIASFDRIDKIKLVTAIAYGGYSCRQVGRPPFGLFKMGVHIPQTGEYHFAFCIDHFCTGGIVTSPCFPYLFYDAILNNNYGIWNRFFIYHIQNCSAFNGDQFIRRGFY